VPSWLELLQGIVSVTRHVQEMQTELRALRSDTEIRVRAMERIQSQTAGENLSGRVRELEQTVAGLTQSIVRLEEARATTRADVRAEITAAVAELRVRYAEEQARRQPDRPSLPDDS